MSPLDPALVALFGAVAAGAVGMVGWTRWKAPPVDPTPAEDEEPPLFRPVSRPAPPREAPAAADPEVERERVAIRRLRVVDRPARAWTDDVGVLEAWWLLGSAAPIPPGRAALAAVVMEARAGRVAALDALDASSSVQVEAVLAGRDPAAVDAWEARVGAVPGPALLRALAARGGTAARDALARLPTPGVRLGEVVCAGLDAGRVDEVLLAAWCAGEPDAWARGDRAWLERELCRRARVDAPGAEELLARLVEEGPVSAATLEEAFGVWPPGRPVPLEGIAGEGSVVERAARLAGAVRAGADVRLEVPGLRAEAFDAEGMGAVLRLDLLRADADGLVETLRAGGPLGWQVVAATWEAIRRVPPGRQSPLIAALSTPVPPGPVARAAGSPPEWLSEPQPRPIELLPLFAAMGADGPWWSGPPWARGG